MSLNTDGCNKNDDPSQGLNEEVFGTKIESDTKAKS